MHDIALMCPACESELHELRCVACGHVYELRDRVPILLVHDAGEHAAAQARWFDEAVDPEWEIERPRGSPRFHRWLLAEKFRRSVDGIALKNVDVLVVCAGSGMDAEFLARRGARVFAVDISVGASRRTLERAARQGLEIGAVVADVERLPFADASFDLVYVHDGLHHLEHPLSGLREMARVARGVVSVTEPARASATRFAMKLGLAQDREDAGNRVTRLTTEEIRADLRDHGFQVVRAGRYAMVYRHEPGLPMRMLSTPGVFSLTRLSFRAVNAWVGRWIGNKLTLLAVRR